VKAEFCIKVALHNIHLLHPYLKSIDLEFIITLRNIVSVIYEHLTWQSKSSLCEVFDIADLDQLISIFIQYFTILDSLVETDKIAHYFKGHDRKVFDSLNCKVYRLTKVMQYKLRQKKDVCHSFCIL